MEQPPQETMHEPPTNGGAPRLSPLERDPSYGQFFITVLLVALAFTAGWFGNNFVNRDYPTPASARPWDKDIWTAWNLIDTQYVDRSAIDHKKMTYAMITAMVNSLGDTGHSNFLTPADAQRVNAGLNNQSFVGIGIYLLQQGNAIILQATIPGSPANAAGLLPGDQFLSVDGHDVTNVTLDQFSALIKGKAGSTVTVTVKRAGTQAPLTFTVTRASIQEKIVPYTYFAEDHIGYVQLLGFDAGAAKEMHDALTTLQKEGATSLILDLRDNGGGLVNEATGIASDFLQPGQTIVYEKDRNNNLTPLKVDSDPSVPVGLHLSLPMTILVNGNSASASEITTGAIQDNRPNVQVIGQRTFGTDTVLVTFQLPSGAELVLGIRQYLTPNKRQFRPGVGLTPSKVVALPDTSFPQTPLVVSELHLTEADMLACKGVNPDPQLIAAIQTLAPARTSVCAAKK